MSVQEQPPPPPLKLVTLNKAFKLAEKWVGQMTGDVEEDAGEMEVESRPARLGLGAIVPRKSEIRLSNDAMERRLQRKLGIGRRKSVGDEECRPSTKSEATVDSDEEDLDSRTSAFAKKRAPPTATPQSRKKRK